MGLAILAGLYCGVFYLLDREWTHTRLCRKDLVRVPGGTGRAADGARA